MPRFKFQPSENGYQVTYRGKNLGCIVAAQEANGRYCFTLACDTQKHPRTYRGRQQAAEALLAIDRLKDEASKKRWSKESLIARAWAVKPRGAAGDGH
jgi:hypothetical protein